MNDQMLTVLIWLWYGDIEYGEGGSDLSVKKIRALKCFRVNHGDQRVLSS